MHPDAPPLHTIGQLLAGDPLAVLAAVVVVARRDAAAGDAQARAWLRACALPAPPAAETPPAAELPPWAPALFRALEAGRPLRQAAAHAGVSHSPVYAWAKRSPAFAQALYQAQAQGRAGRRAPETCGGPGHPHG